MDNHQDVGIRGEGPLRGISNTTVLESGEESVGRKVWEEGVGKKVWGGGCGKEDVGGGCGKEW